MHAQQNTSFDPSNPTSGNHHPKQSGRALGGMVIVAVGAVLLAKQAGADLPHWLFSWGMFFIVIGLFVGVKHSFRDVGWLILMSIGSVLLIDTIMEEISLRQYLWPIVIIIAGLAMIFRSKKSSGTYFKSCQQNNALTSEEDHTESVTIFGGVKKNIISKNFCGGESVTVFGGTELNLLQADFSGRIELEVVQVFGGTKLIVPAHWKIHAEELVSVFGGLNDKRPIPTEASVDQSKVLVLKGTSFFGGIDIKSY